MGRSKTKKKNQNRNYQNSNPDTDQGEVSERTDFEESVSVDEVHSGSAESEDYSARNCNSNMTDIFQGDSTPLVSDSLVLESEDSNNQSNMEDTLVITEENYVAEELKPEPSSTIASASALPKTKALQSAKAGSDVCQHLVKGVSMAGVRKAFKNDIKPICQGRPCMSRSSDPSLKSTASSLWFCLQCGSIGCGDQDAQNGDAMIHHKTPRSDCHSVFTVLGENYRCWCFICQMEVSSSNSFLKDAVLYIKRLSKTRLGFSKLGQSSNQPVSSVPIALGPPPPPPPPANPPKSFQNKNKQQTNKNKISYPNSHSNGNEWPLGLENLGNTCFMNSALQCLSRTRMLTPQLELYGSGNLIEIMVSAEEPSVTILKTKAAKIDILEDGDAPSSPERIYSLNSDNDKEDCEDKSSSSPASELDSVLEGAESNSSKDGKEEVTSKFAKEIELEMKNPLKLNLEIPKESMTGRLKHAFKAVTRHPDVVPGSDPYPHREFLHRNDGPYGFRPNDIHSSLSKQFRPMQQHDSHELLRSIVDMMKKDQIKAFRLAIMDRYGVKRSEVKNLDPKLAELLKQWDRKLYHKTFVDEIFGGELVTTQTCLECNSVRRSHEDFLDLSLPIRVAKANPNPSNNKKSYSLFEDEHDIVINRTLDASLRAFTEPELLTGDNNVECENCHRINLEKLAAGANIEDIFPSAKRPCNSDENSRSEENSSSPVKNKSAGKQKRQEDRKKKRQPRQTKMRARLLAQEASKDMDTIDSVKSSDASLAIIEDHFTNEKSGKSVEKVKSGSEDEAKSSKSGSLDDYVVINPITSSASSSKNKRVAKNYASNGKRKYNELEQDVEGYDEDEEDELPALVQVGHKNLCEDDTTASSQGLNDLISSNLSKGLSESLQNLSIIPTDEMDVNGDAEMDNDNESLERNHGNDNDFDLDDLDMPAVDGAIDASDAEEDNGVPPLDLGFIEDTTQGTDNMISVIGSGNCDEGYSEGENSSEEKHSRSSSSRNSACESEAMDIKSEKIEEKKKPIPVTKCPCSRQQNISRPPEILTIHLKRFQMTTRFHTSKVTNHVDFPFILDLTKFCSEVPEDCKKPNYKSIYDDEGEVIYGLYGIVEHSGSLHWGHYVAYVRVAGKNSTGLAGDCNNEGKTDDKWFYISDSHVTPTTPSAINHRDAYILFYERVRGEEKKARIAQYYFIDLAKNRSGPSSSFDTDWEQTSTSYAIPMSMPGTVSSGWTESWEPDENTTTETINPSSAELSSTADYTGLPGPSSFSHPKVYNDGDEGIENDDPTFNSMSTTTSTATATGPYVSSSDVGVDSVQQANSYSNNWMYDENSPSSSYPDYGISSQQAMYTVPLASKAAEIAASTTPTTIDEIIGDERTRSRVGSADMIRAYSQLEDVD